MPRFSEDPSLLKFISEKTFENEGSSVITISGLLPESILQKIPKGQRKGILKDLELIFKYLEIKETGRDFMARETALLRRLLLEAGRRFSLGNDIFYLELDEILAINESSPHVRALKELAVKRRKNGTAFLAINLPVMLEISDIESVGLKKQSQPKTGELIGQRVSGSGEIKGTVRFGQDARSFSIQGKDDILVTPLSTTDWVVFMPGLKAIITESGGMLSHLAILAREMNVAYVAGAAGACEILKDGDFIIIYPDGRVVKDKAK
jgi:phosphohistidine swiveling domain-containing protein